MLELIAAQRGPDAVPLHLVREAELADWLESLPPEQARWLQAGGFNAAPNSHCLIAGPDGRLAGAAAGVGEELTVWSLSAAAAALPAGQYYFAADPGAACERLALGWALAGYRYDRFRSGDPEPGAVAVLALDHDAAHAAAEKSVAAVQLVRDLINTPAESLPPLELAAAARDLAQTFGAEFGLVSGDDLLAQNFPAVHAVGRAASNPPCLIELHWGDPSHPRIALVGKGVVFDSGGLDIKPASGMRLMKKDMGGAAHALGVARLVMSHRLPVRLHLVIPAVENAIAGNAYRPGDVVATRRGLSIEIDNTDAEGRVILSDALALACEAEPELVIDFATLTGAARVALGTELPALFCNDDRMADELARAGAGEDDPVWRLPLHQPYRELIKSRVADVLNSGATPYGGAITAALFLERFVTTGTPWAHIDVMAWNTAGKPGRPEGGEAMSLRAVFAYLRQRFAAG